MENVPLVVSQMLSVNLSCKWFAASGRIQLGNAANHILVSAAVSTQ